MSRSVFNISDFVIGVRIPLGTWIDVLCPCDLSSFSCVAIGRFPVGESKKNFGILIRNPQGSIANRSAINTTKTRDYAGHSNCKCTTQFISRPVDIHMIRIREGCRGLVTNVTNECNPQI